MQQNSNNVVIDGTFQPAGWTWIKRFTEKDERTGEVKQIDECRALMGWKSVSDEYGNWDHIGITAGPEGGDPVIPAPEAEGFVGYEQPKNGSLTPKTGQQIREVVLEPGPGKPVATVSDITPSDIF